jgi:hypothetical protein
MRFVGLIRYRGRHACTLAVPIKLAYHINGIEESPQANWRSAISCTPATPCGTDFVGVNASAASADLQSFGIKASPPTSLTVVYNMLVMVGGLTIYLLKTKKLVTPNRLDLKCRLHFVTELVRKSKAPIT